MSSGLPMGTPAVALLGAGLLLLHLAALLGGASATLRYCVTAGVLVAFLLIVPQLKRHRHACQPRLQTCESFLEKRRRRILGLQKTAQVLPLRLSDLQAERLPAKPKAQSVPQRPVPNESSLSVAPHVLETSSVEVSGRQVFDVQWSFSGKELNALEFKRPAGTGPSGGFFRPCVDQDSDCYRLLLSDECAGQFQLKQYTANGELKHQLTTFGQIKAISKEVILYSGDAQYGTLITLRRRYDYGSSARFAGLITAPSREQILEVFRAYHTEQLQGVGGDSPVSSLAPEVKTPLRINCSLQDMARPSMRVRFRDKVSTVFLRNLREIPPERKADFWWSQDDFAEFLKVRVQIGKVYRQAAKQMGVDIFKVSSEGSMREEAYSHMVSQFPELGQDSRRGLGLGRKNQRARNRDAYIAAVLKEQARQKSLALQKSADGCPSVIDTDRSEVQSDASEADTTAPTTPLDLPSPTSPSRPFVLDEEALAQVATSISKKDREYAHFLAQIYYEQDRIEMGFPPTSQPQELSNPQWGRPNNEGEESPTSPGSLSPNRRGFEEEEALPQDDADLKDENEDGLAGVSKKVCPSKGFGISRDKLLEVGLSATGHAVSRRARLSCKPLDGNHSDGESDIESGNSDWET